MAPAWYADWRHDAVHSLMEKNAILDRDLRMNQWPRWHYEMDRRELTFSDDTRVRLIAEIQIVGSTAAHDWLWSWANSHWSDELTVDARLTRDFGVANDIQELTSASISDESLNDLGWELTAVAAKVTNAVGAYRPQSETGGLFLLIRSIAEVKSA